VVTDGDRHPMRRLVEAGLVCTVNSDDPPMFGTTLVDEYRLLAGQGFDWDALWALAGNAVEAAFLDAGERAALRARFAAWRAADAAAVDGPAARAG
jgi:adenosine deaminase